MELISGQRLALGLAALPPPLPTRLLTLLPGMMQNLQYFSQGLNHSQ